jgi:sulfur carrier protein ThiS
VDLEVPEEGTVKDLLAMLNIPEKTRPIVVLEGRILKGDDRMRGGSCVSVFEPIHGG